MLINANLILGSCWKTQSNTNSNALIKNINVAPWVSQHEELNKFFFNSKKN